MYGYLGRSQNSLVSYPWKSMYLVPTQHQLGSTKLFNPASKPIFMYFQKSREGFHSLKLPSSETGFEECPRPSCRCCRYTELSPPVKITIRQLNAIDATSEILIDINLGCRYRWLMIIPKTIKQHVFFVICRWNHWKSKWNHRCMWRVHVKGPCGDTVTGRPIRKCSSAVSNRIEQIYFQKRQDLISVVLFGKFPGIHCRCNRTFLGSKMDQNDLFKSNI